MMKMKLLIFILICIGVPILGMGCKNDVPVIPDGEENGGKHDVTDKNAPKTIASEELISFEIDFYRWADYVYDKNRSYQFKMWRNDDGSFMITEGSKEELKCATDKAFATKLQQLIKEYDLAASNGKYEYTNGLPEEFRPEYINAGYASGEKISICTDGNPESEFDGKVLDLFAKEFGAHGINDLLPSEEDTEMTGFSLEYTFGDIRYLYGEIWIPIEEEEENMDLEELVKNGYVEDNCVKKIYASPWDRTGKTDFGEEKMVDPSKEHYRALQQIVEDTGLIYLQNGKIFPGDFDYINTPQYYEFNIEYKSGKAVSGFSDDPSECETFKPFAEKIAGYYENYLSKQ